MLHKSDRVGSTSDFSRSLVSAMFSEVLTWHFALFTSPSTKPHAPLFFFFEFSGIRWHFSCNEVGKGSPQKAQPLTRMSRMLSSPRVHLFLTRTVIKNTLQRQTKTQLRETCITKIVQQVHELVSDLGKVAQCQFAASSYT